MRKASWIGALSAVAAVLCLAQGAHAATLTFNDIDIAPAPYGHHTNGFDYGGLHFKDNEVDIIGAGAQPLPGGDSTQFMEAGSGVDGAEALTITLAGGGAFNLWSLEMGLGAWNLSDLDTVTITGVKASDCTGDCTDVTTVVSVNDAFSLYSLSGFTDLASLIVGQQMYGPAGAQQIDAGWLAFDNMVYTTGTEGPPGVPEPAAWALMIVGFGGIGAILRRRRRAQPAAA